MLLGRDSIRRRDLCPVVFPARERHCPVQSFAGCSEARSEPHTESTSKRFSMMSKNPCFVVFGLTVLLTTAGCKYDRSFMQMDSNSGSPFLGLQWAVDSGSRPGISEETQSGRELLVNPEANPHPSESRSRGGISREIPQVFTVANRSAAVSKSRRWPAKPGTALSKDEILDFRSPEL